VHLSVAVFQRSTLGVLGSAKLAWLTLSAPAFLNGSSLNSPTGACYKQMCADEQWMHSEQHIESIENTGAAHLLARWTCNCMHCDGNAPRANHKQKCARESELF
jgi:hypothetical protein